MNENARKMLVATLIMGIAQIIQTVKVTRATKEEMRQILETATTQALDQEYR